MVSVAVREAVVVVDEVGGTEDLLMTHEACLLPHLQSAVYPPVPTEGGCQNEINLRTQVH